MKSRLKQLEFIWYEELLISNELRAYCHKHYRKDEKWHCCKVKRTTSQSRQDAEPRNKKGERKRYSVVSLNDCRSRNVASSNNGNHSIPGVLKNYEYHLKTY